MMISTRNQISCVVESVDNGVVSSVVSLIMPQGTKLYASITQSSSQTMHLQKSDKVIALFKASHVMIGLGWSMPLSARNKLEGIILKITRGVVNTEVAIELLSGDVVYAMITDNSAQDMALKEGMSVVAIIKSSDIIIAK